MATRLEKQILACQHLRIIYLSASRNAQVSGVKLDQTQDVVTDFRFTVRAIAVGRGQAIGLRRCAVIDAAQAGGQAHVAGKGVHVLLVEVGLSGFPAEPAHDDLLLRIVPDPVGAARDAIGVLVIGIGVGEDGVICNGFQQPQADHRRGNARRDMCFGVHRAVAQLGDPQRWLTQLDSSAVAEIDRQRVVLDPHLAFRFDAGVRHVLQLPAIRRSGNTPLRWIRSA